MLYSVFALIEDEWKRIAWDLPLKEARSLVLSCRLIHDTKAEYLEQEGVAVNYPEHRSGLVKKGKPIRTNKTKSS